MASSTEGPGGAGESPSKGHGDSIPPPASESSDLGWLGDIQNNFTGAIDAFSLPHFTVEDLSNITAGYLNEAVEALTTTVDGGAAFMASSIKDVRIHATDWGQNLRESLDPVAKEACRLTSLAGEHQRKAVSAARAHYFLAYDRHPEAVSFASFAALVLAFPATRRFVFRRALRLRSQEGLYKSAERRKAVLSQSVDLHLQETKKLLDRTKAAKEEFFRAQKKLRDARNQLDSLQTRLHRTDRTVWGLLDDLSLVRTKEAAGLRTEIAVNKGIVQKQSRLVRGAIKDIAASAGI